MKQNTNKLFKGSAVAMAVAGMLSGAQVTADETKTEAVSTTELAHCYNVNKCKGHNDCKTAENACAGQSSCKGQGFVEMSTKACADVGGELKDKVRGTVKTADLTQCYNVNICKGHNDCKTAENACAGHSACKGQGFVNISAKSCENIGGKVGA